MRPSGGMALLWRAVVLGLTLAAAAAAADAPQQRTQAGCACVPSWKDAAGAAHSGCANPDADPLGDWCAVDAAACQGYHSTFVDAAGATVHYDYCGEVRERTKAGCLCASEWRVDGVGKALYRNRCAHPDTATGRKCRVNPATCPPGAAVGAFDDCEPLDEAGAAGAGAGSTARGCTCLGSWSYRYPAAGAAEAAVLSGCANPDGDPLGPWCIVDSDRCERFAGYAGVDEAYAAPFDYCGSTAPTPAPRGGGCAPERVPQWGQCGGKADCSEWGCADAAWPGACCVPGMVCARIHAYYYQCVLPSVAAAIAAGSGSSVLEAGAAPLPGGGADTGGSAAAAAAPAAAAGATTTSDVAAALPSLQAKEAGETVYVRLRINYPYDLIASDVGAQARLKSDLTGWLKAHAAPQQYVYAAGVTSLLNGSVVADSYVTFTADAPPEVVASAAPGLQSGAAALYQDSNLPTSWGPLLALEASATRDALTLAAAPDSAAALAAAPAPGERGGDGGRVQLSAGAYAGIAIGCAVFVGLLALVVHRGLQMNKERDRSKSAQLAYMNELTEAEIAAAEGDDEKEGLEAIGWALPPAAAATGGRAAGLPASSRAAAPPSAGGAAPAELLLDGAEPSPAFLPVPDGEARRRRSSGERGGGGSLSGSGGAAAAAAATLKHRHGGSSAGSASPAAPGGTPLARAQGPAGGSGSHFGAALSKLGSTVASYVSGGGGGGAAAPEAAPGKRE
ncbi:hypothetical protein Rsub_09072 [Raphidocelis subcapitata]|uniref:CBM1 domain-containing protein n=1 Tax=Raphidocelis subcapitata TaxID=307507 RepID=A0A2V0PGE7_9CHLO|nr:hypothetical protein Rsub_09072 [Raphidocelis subcapitata]|eukprot:GBF96277.1 hypothetical protein Rsub_09072 [Raphidocelis subcapitata]